MPNVVSRQVIEPARIELSYVGEFNTRPFKTLTERFLLTAHRMVEQYLGKPRPIAKVTATYTISEPSAPLTALENYPINMVISVLDVNDAPIADIKNDDRYVWSNVSWSSSVVVQYVGGIEQTVFDAIIRQSRVMASRDDISPEKTDKTVGPLTQQWDPKFRSGLAPDVKQMLFAYRELGF